MDDGDLLAAELQRVLEREACDSAGTVTGIHAGRDRHRVRIVANRDVVFEGDVEAFEILADQHDVDILEPAPRDQRVGGAQIGVEMEFFAQTHVDGAETAAHRRGQRPLQRQFGPVNTVQRGLRQRVPSGRDAGQAALLDVPDERGSQRLQHLDDGVYDLRTDAVAGDQRCGNFASTKAGRCRAVHGFRTSSRSV